MAERRLRPMTLGDIFDEGFDLYKKNFSFLVLVTLVVTVPLDIVLGFVKSLYWKGPSLFDAIKSDDASNLFGPAFGQTVSSLFVTSLIYAAPLAALAAATSARYLGDPITLRQAYRMPMRRLPALLGTALLYSIILSACSGILWPVVSLIFTAHVFAIEGKAGTGAIKRTASLVSGDWWRVLGALVMLGLVYLVLTISIAVPLGYAFDTLLRLGPGDQSLFLPGDALHSTAIRRQVVGQLSSGLSHLFLLPFVLSVLTVLYYDLRVRKEAFDVDLLIKDLGYSVGDPSRGMIPPVVLSPKPAVTVAPNNRGRS
jgi:hypothetical protein